MIAERALTMRVAMGLLAVLAIVGGIVAIPKTTSWLDHFLAPAFADSTIVSHASNGMLYLGLVLGAVISVGSIAIAYVVWVDRPSLAAATRTRLRPLASLFEHKWYFDELIDVSSCAPAPGSAASRRTPSSGSSSTAR